MSRIEWNKIRTGRDQAASNLKPILKLPLIAGSMDLIQRVVKDGDGLLDVGANNRSLEKALRTFGKQVEYYSCDIDRSLPHDYYDLSEITLQFDVITFLEVMNMSPWRCRQAISTRGGIIEAGWHHYCQHPQCLSPCQILARLHTHHAFSL